MSPDPLGTALRDLVDDVEAGSPRPSPTSCGPVGAAVVAPPALVPVVAAACVAALVTVALWPSGAPRASVPAVTVDDDGTARLTAYPYVIAKPPSIRTTTTPGCAAALIPGSGDLAPIYAVSRWGRLPGALPQRRVGVRGTLALAQRSVGLPRARAHRPHGGAAVPSRAERPGSWGRGRRPESPHGGRPTPAGSSSRPLTKGARGLRRSGGGYRWLAHRGAARRRVGWYRSSPGGLDEATLLALLDLGPGDPRLELRT